MSILESFLAGKEARRTADAAEQINAMQQFIGQNGKAIMGGDANALGQLAGFGQQGLQMAMGIQGDVQSRERQAAADAAAAEERAYGRERDKVADGRADQEWQMQLEEYAAGKTAAERAAEASQIEEGVKGALMTDSPEAWDAFVTQNGLPDMVGKFDQRDSIAAQFMSVAEVLKSTAPPDPPESTASQKDYLFYSQQETEAGRTPLSFNDWDTQGKKAGAATTNISTGSDIGTIPQGWELVTDPATGAKSMRPIVGGPEDKSRAASNAAGADMIATDTITTAAARARDAAKNRQLGGFGAGLAAQNPYTDSAEVERQIDVLRANAATTTLQAMRDASPTGSTGLGALTAPEMKVIQDKAGALNQNSPNFLRDLEDYERTLLRVIHGPEAGGRIFEATRAGAIGAGGSGSPVALSQEEEDFLMQGP